MKQKPKIVFLAPLYVPGSLTGSEIVIRDLAEELHQLDYRVTVITSDVRYGRSWYDPFFSTTKLDAHSVVNGVDVVRLRCRPILSAFLFILNKFLHHFYTIDRIELLSWGPIWKNLKDTIRSERADIVVMSPFPAGICLTGSEISKELRIPYAVIPFVKKHQLHTKNKLLGNILDDATYIFTPTKTEKKDIHKFTQNTKIFQLPSSVDNVFIDTHRRKIQKKSEQYKNIYNLHKKNVILFVGNKGVGKGIIDAARAIDSLHMEDLIFITVGNSTPQWEAYLEKHCHPGWIIDIPYVTGIAKYAYYALCDLLILPSVTDNFPLVFLEAWSFRKPVLSYDYYTIKEILTDGSGYMVKPFDINALANAINYLLCHPKRMRLIGSIGYNKVQQYSRKQITQKYFLHAFG